MRLRRKEVAGWVSKHQFEYAQWQDIPYSEMLRIKTGLERFKVENPIVSIVIPVWNEAAHLMNTLSSFAEMNIPYNTELIVVNNNSTDETTDILEYLGVRTIDETKQGISFARLTGLNRAEGVYHLCADGDALYPPDWIETMVQPMMHNAAITCVYGHYSFLPDENASRNSLAWYELFSETMYAIRKLKREFLNVRGLNMGFRTDEGRVVRGFDMPLTRKFDSNPENGNYVVYGEDGRMGRKLGELGLLFEIKSDKARIWTSPRRLTVSGSVLSASLERFKKEGTQLFNYVFGSKKLTHTTDDLLT